MYVCINKSITLVSTVIMCRQSNTFEIISQVITARCYTKCDKDAKINEFYQCRPIFIFKKPIYIARHTQWFPLSNVNGVSGIKITLRNN